MASFTVEVRNIENTKRLDGVTVKAKYNDWLGNEKIKEEITDQSGKAYFEIGVIQTDIQLEASKSGSIDKTTIFINVVGQAEPDYVVMNLAFKPTEKIFDITNDFTKFLTEQGKILTVTTAIVLGIGGIIYIATKAKNVNITQSASNVKQKVKSKYPNFKK